MGEWHIHLVASMARVYVKNILQFLRVRVGEKHDLYNGQGLGCKWQQIGKLSVNHLQLLDFT
jgi:hypothetical protein